MFDYFILQLFISFQIFYHEFLIRLTFDHGIEMECENIGHKDQTTLVFLGPTSRKLFSTLQAKHNTLVFLSLLAGMFFSFFALGATGGFTYLLTSDKPIF